MEKGHKESTNIIESKFQSLEKITEEKAVDIKKDIILDKIDKLYKKE